MPFIERSRDNEGRLFLKYFLADDTLNDRGWRLSPESLEAFAKSFVGKPFTVMKDVKESLFGDYHPFAPKESATVQEDIDFAEKYAIGHIIDVTPTPKERLGAGATKGYEAIIEIEDPVARVELAKDNTHLIPPEVSPGIVRLAGSKTNVEEFWGLHLAAVPQGAYGPRAREVARCAGEHRACVHTLLSASNYEWAKLPSNFGFHQAIYKGRTGECPINALENLSAASISSLSSDSNSLNSSMSFNSTSGSAINSNVGKAPAPRTYGTNTFITPTGTNIGTQNYTRLQSQTPVQQGQQPQTPAQKPKIVIKSPKRFLVNFKGINQNDKDKTLSEQTQAQPNQTKQEAPTTNPIAEVSKPVEQPQQSQQATDPKILKELEELRQATTRHDRIYSLSKIIPFDLFVDKNGKFQQHLWQTEVEKMAERNLPDDVIKELYDLKRKARQQEIAAEIAAQVPQKKNTGRLGASSIAITNDSSQVDEEQEKLIKLLKLNGGL